MIISHWLTWMALATTTAYGRPSEEPTATNSIEEMILKHPKTAAVALLLTGVGVGGPFYRGLRQAFASYWGSQSCARKYHAEYPYPLPKKMPPNEYPEDAIVITTMELMKWFQRGWPLPYRPELTPKQEALRQGFIQGVGDAGAVSDSDEIAKLLDGFDEGYQAKVDERGHAQGHKKGYELARRFRDRPGLGDAYERGYRKGYERAHYTNKHAATLRKDVDHAHKAGLAMGICYWEQYDEWAACGKSLRPTLWLMEEWLDTCGRKVAEHRLEELILKLRGEKEQEQEREETSEDRVAKTAPAAGRKQFFNLELKPSSVKELSNSIKTFAKSTREGFVPGIKKMVASFATSPKQPVRLSKPLAVVH
ncbi:MAG: hypothetical protein M1823_000940 [Watsoniomyces obsoletus]|nr:MAG: hypothetical protein M1823_000940 [Watsoniomyces obsoletus]